MIDDDVLQVPLPLKKRHDLNPDAQTVYFQRAAESDKGRTVNHNVIHVHSGTKPER